MRTAKKIVKPILVLLIALAVILAAMAGYHHIRLNTEASKITGMGSRVEINGYHMNLLAQGEKQPAAPTLVLLSGSGVAAPIYDYKVLYSKLPSHLRVVVVEKFGYGYSDVSGLPRDVATMVEESRAALDKAGESGPYVLMPHSMSALEAIYWAYTYPDEVAAIVGLDMAVPASYQKDNLSQITLMKVGVFFGFHRLPIFNPVSRLALNDEEYEQHQLLNARNSLNTDVYNECKTVLKNAQTVSGMDISAVPMLMFTTNLGGGAAGEIWSAAQDEFAAGMNRCEQIKYDCGHNLHYDQSEDMAEKIIAFLEQL